MINIHLFMFAFCLSSMTFITWLYVKPSLIQPFDDPYHPLNRAPSPSTLTTVYFYAEDLTTDIQFKPLNMALIAGLGGVIYGLLLVCNIAYRQYYISRGVR